MALALFDTVISDNTLKVTLSLSMLDAETAAVIEQQSVLDHEEKKPRTVDHGALKHSTEV